MDWSSPTRVIAYLLRFLFCWKYFDKQNLSTLTLALINLSLQMITRQMPDDSQQLANFEAPLVRFMLQLRKQREL